jgi:glucosamine 6-phosphate synthetase-like amidotransferase/phosphosugar isomerase protein
MCCIFGVGFLKDHRLSDSDAAIGMISKLFKGAEVGGRHASGISILSERIAGVIRRPMSSSQLIETDEYMDFMEKYLKLGDKEEKGNRITSVIGHCRFPTKGGINNNLNNHPQVIDHIIGVHNGTILNDDALFEEFKDKFSRIAEVDTEIIFQLIAHFSKDGRPNTRPAIEKSAKLLSGGFACAVQNVTLPYHLYLFRQYNPIRVFLYKKIGIVVFGTREHFIEPAMKLLEEDMDIEAEEIEMLTNSGMVFNLHDCTFSKFSI